MKRVFIRNITGLMLLTASASAFAAGTPVANVFVNGNPADANAVNANFQELADRIAELPTEAGGIQGPVGEAGPQGIAGADGTTGPQGLQGLTGTEGVAGSQGPQGIVGATGSQGLAGTDGAIGLQGLQGIAGADGVAGPQGPAGEALESFDYLSYSPSNVISKTFTNIGGVVGDVGYNGWNEVVFTYERPDANTTIVLHDFKDLSEYNESARLEKFTM